MEPIRGYDPILHPSAPHKAGFATSPFPSLGSHQPQSSHQPWGSPGARGELSSRVVPQGPEPWVLPHVHWSPSPQPPTSLGCRACPWSYCRTLCHQLPWQSKLLNNVLETIAPGRHEPPNICKSLDLLILWDFCKICFNFHCSSSVSSCLEVMLSCIAHAKPVPFKYQDTSKRICKCLCPSPMHS